MVWFMCCVYRGVSKAEQHTAVCHASEYMHAACIEQRHNCCPHSWLQKHGWAFFALWQWHSFCVFCQMLVEAYTQPTTAVVRACVCVCG
jgi:hypothetical protein